MVATQSSLALERQAPPLHENAQGVLRVGQTRVTLESVISFFEQGASAEEIAMRCDVMDLHDVCATLSYCLGHRQVMKNYLDHAPGVGSGTTRRGTPIAGGPDSQAPGTLPNPDQWSACWLTRISTGASYAASCATPAGWRASACKTSTLPDPVIRQCGFGPPTKAGC